MSKVREFYDEVRLVEEGLSVEAGGTHTSIEEEVFKLLNYCSSKNMSKFETATKITQYFYKLGLFSEGTDL